MANLPLDYEKITAQKSDLFTILSPAAGSFATRTSSKFNTMYNHGIAIIMKLANKLGTVSFTPQVHAFDEDGNAIIWWTAAAAVSANGTTTFVLFPGGMAGKGAGVTEAADIVLPRVFDVSINYTGAGDGNEFDTEVYGMFL